MRQSILFFDIDGTLLSDKTGKIPDSALEALAEAKKNGHLLFINTGRTVCALPKELYQLNLMDTCVGADRIFSSMMKYYWKVILRKPVDKNILSRCGNAG